SRPELSQGGRTVLITGGGAGIGFFTAEAFIRASAATVVIVGRRPEVLAQARLDLQKKAAQLEKPAIVVAEVCDVANRQSVAALWDKLGEQDISVDVLVLSAARVTESVPLLDVGVEELAAAFRANVLGPHHFAQRLYQQPTKGPKV
ncbi:SDR family oxidoreductase, partial [Candidatus Bathyarchaeota archaeon]|nr:SDR family oxidoreductase [Candidatus Bathyarchaeota archaeon]